MSCTIILKTAGAEKVDRRESLFDVRWPLLVVRLSVQTFSYEQRATNNNCPQPAWAFEKVFRNHSTHVY